MLNYISYDYLYKEKKSYLQNIPTYLSIFLSSETKIISERGLMMEKCLEGQKSTRDLVKEFGGSTNEPLTKVK
jgi:hypothetical protein